MIFNFLEDIFDNNRTSDLFLIAGPCVIEDELSALHIASVIKDICENVGVNFIFKASYKKANRTKIDSFTGIGDEAGLEVLKKVRTSLNIPVLTDIHSVQEAAIAAHYVDVIQIPAFLSRQTEIILAAAETGKHVNIKKAQFSSAESMQFVVEKIKSTGNNKIMLTERGTMFGYQDLVVDFKGVAVMQKLGCPVVLDCSHSTQHPNQPDGITSGNKQFIEILARAGVAVGVNGLFIETHPEPSKAKSDSDSMLPLQELEDLLKKAVVIQRAVGGF